MSNGIVQIFQRKEQPVVPTLSMCVTSSLSTKKLEWANDHVSRVLCAGDCESAKFTPRAHYNDYTAKERAETEKYVAEGSCTRCNAIRNSSKFKIAKIIYVADSDCFAKFNGRQNFPLYGNKLDRWWSSVGASLSCVVGGMLSERVGSMDARMHYVCVKSCPECNVHMLYLWCRKCEKGLVWSDRREKLTYVKPKDSWRHQQGSASIE